jgi:hypothetical protein
MRRTLVSILVLVVALLVSAEAAAANRPVLKVSGLNLGNVGAGEVAAGFVTITNRSNDPVLIESYGLGAGYGGHAEFGVDACFPLLGSTLAGGASCTTEIRVTLFAHHYFQPFCVNSDFCAGVRATSSERKVEWAVRKATVTRRG